jgi:hypothetical protein
MDTPTNCRCSTFTFKSTDCPTDEQWNQDNSVIIVTRLRVGWLKKQGLIFGSGSSERSSWPTRFSIQWVLGSFSPEVKWPQREAECLPPTSARSGINGAVPLSPPPYFHVTRSDNLTFSFTCIDE